MIVKRALSLGIAGILGLSGVAAIAEPALAGGGVDLQAACNNQYPGQGRVVRNLSPYNAYSWRCVTGVVPVTPGEISVTAQCKVQYGSGSYGYTNNWQSPSSWLCT